MSGHSKWKTIKYKKAVTDAKKSKVFSRISRMLSVAVREGGAKPEHNNALRLAIEKAREANMPGDNIQKIISKYSVGGKGQMEVIRFEGYGPAGTAFIIDVITDSRNRAAQEIRHALSSHGGSMASPGSVLWLFEKYGEIVLPLDGISFAFAEELALEMGAHNIIEEDGKAIVLTLPDDLARAIKCFAEKKTPTESAGITYRAKNTVPIADAALKEKIESLYEALDGNEDVQDIFDNVAFTI